MLPAEWLIGDLHRQNTIGTELAVIFPQQAIAQDIPAAVFIKNTHRLNDARSFTIRKCPVLHAQLLLAYNTVQYQFQCIGHCVLCWIFTGMNGNVRRYAFQHFLLRTTQYRFDLGHCRFVVAADALVTELQH
ncbi:hypothetical protein D3C72_1635210 [compost metagenome]